MNKKFNVVLEFTFHSVSIKSEDGITAFKESLNKFTFHSVSIKSQVLEW